MQKVYVGGGALGEIAAKEDDLGRWQRAAEREAWRTERERVEVVDADLDELCRLTDSLVEAALRKAGYTKHKGEWRRKRAERDARQATAGRGEA